MVGDTRFDVIGAHEHGLACIGVLWGIGSEEELRETGADPLVATPGELLAALGVRRVLARRAMRRGRTTWHRQIEGQQTPGIHDR